MPDFGLTEALAAALKAKGAAAEGLGAGEKRLAGQAAEAAPPAAAPEVPGTQPAPSVQTPSATPAEGDVQAPPLNPSQPPADLPPPAPGDVADGAGATPATPDVAAGSADAAPPVPAPEEPPVAPPPVSRADELRARGIMPGSAADIALGNKLPPPAPNARALTDVEASAQKFVTANLGDFPAEKLNMTHMPNVDVINSPNGLKAALLQVADDNRELIEGARGKAASNAQLTGLAQDLSVNQDTLQQTFDREFGTVADTAGGDQRRALITAARIVEQNELGTVAALSDRILKGTATSDDIIQWQQHSQAIVDWRTRLAGASAEAGRNLQTLGIKVGDTLPNEVRDHIADILKQNNPDMQATAAAIKLAMSPGGIANIVNGMAGKSLWARMGQAASSLIMRTFINGILSGPPTWLKIFIGNNFNLAMNSFDIFAAGIGRGTVGFASRAGAYPTAAEGATISDAVAHIHGVITGSANAFRMAGRVLRSGQSMDALSRAGENAGTSGRMTTNQILPEIQGTWFGSLMSGIDKALDSPGHVIGAIDQFTRSMGENGWLNMMQLKEVRARIAEGTLKPGDAEQVMQDLVKNPSPEMQQAAQAWGARMTFQTPFPEGGPGEAFQQVLNKAPALRLIFPFMRTATNIFKQSVVERATSPLLAIFSQRLRSQLAAGGFEGDLAKSRIATGTALISMYAWMAIHDRTTGDAPKDAKERAEWELDGRTPNSIRITDPLTGKDTWRSYAWFEPQATIVSAVSDVVRLKAYLHSNEDVYTMQSHDDKLNDAISHIAASVIQNTGNKTFMQGASIFSEAYNDPQRMFSTMIDQTGASMVPFSGALKFARNLQDPYMRQAYTLMDKVRDELPTIPGVVNGSKTLPSRPDVFGEQRMHNGGNSILGPMNPLPGSPSKKDDVTDEIQSIMEQTRTVPVTMPSAHYPLQGGGGIQDGRSLHLTPSEYNDLVQKSRSDPVFDNGTLNFREKLEQTINSPLYQTATPPARAEYLGAVQRSADKMGRANLYKDNDDFRERLIEAQSDKNRQKFNQ